MTTEQRGEIAFGLSTQVKENEAQRRLLLAENVQLLNTILEKKYYKDLLGDEEGEWSGFLADLEVFYSRNQVNSFIKLYKKLTTELEVEPEKWVRLPISRLIACLPLLQKENYEEWFAKISTLTAHDFNLELREARGNPITDDHVHDMQNYEICRTCGERHKV